MPYTRPPFLTLKNRIEADLTNLSAALKKVFSVVWAKAVHSLHGHLEWVDAQCSPLTCELERLYDWAALYSVNRLDPVAAFGNVLATGNVGSVVLLDSLLRADNGLDYIVTSAVTLAAGNNNVPVRCVTAGSAGNLSAGATLTLVDPILGVANTFTVANTGVSGGAELEDVDDWRLRVVDEWQTVASRGARSGKVEDYKAWAKNAHPSVTSALVQLHTLGYGSVVVRPICNSLTNRLPTSGIIETVEQTLLDIAPATADWTVAAPIVRNVNINIDLQPGVDSAENRAAIQAAIITTIHAEVSETSVLGMAELDAAIATVTTQYTRIAPLADIAVTPGEVLVLNNLVWS